MRVKLIAALGCVVAAAACADSAAPITEPRLAAANAVNHRGGGSPTGSISIVAPKPVTLPFSTVDCNGNLVTGTSTHYALAIAAQGPLGTFDLTGAFDAVNATDPTGVTYTGSNLVLNTSLLGTKDTVFFVDQDFDLRPRSRTLKSTYLDIVTAYVSTPSGPVLTKATITTKCQNNEHGNR